MNCTLTSLYPLLQDKVGKRCIKNVVFQVKYYRDTYAEHPDDRVNIEYTVPLDNQDALVTLSGMYDQVRAETGANLEYSRYN